MKKFLLMIMLATAVTPMIGCKEKGPAEEAGEKVDEAAEDVSRTVKDATD